MAISGAGLQSIYQRLNSAAEYHPLEADTFADWSLEAGDIVTVTRDGTGYESPVHNATHVWKGQQIVRIASGGDEKRESVARMSRRKYAGSGSGVRSGQMLGNRITMVYNGLSAEIVQTESEVSTRMQDMYNGLESYVVQTASVWGSALADAYNGLSSTIVQTASAWSSELQDAYNGLDSKVEQTASHWSSELNSAYNGLSSKVEQTESNWNVRLDNTYAGLSSRITATDGKVEAEASARQSDVTDIKGRLIVEAGKAGLVAEVTDSREILYLPDRSVFPTVGQADKIYLDVIEETYYEYKNGTYVVTTPGKTIKAGSITTAINEAGESEAHIDAQKVYIGNSKSTTIISGKLDAADVTSDYLNAKLAQINLLNVRSIATNTADGTSSFSSYYGNHYYLHFPGGGGSVYNEDMRDGIKDVQIAGPTNNVYKLQYKKYGDSAWRDADVPFSRAIDSASWEWANGRPTVTLSPQSQSFPGTQITHATPAYDSTLNKWMMEIQAMGSGTPPTYTNIGHSVNLNNYLQNLTGTNKITSNGTYTPPTSGSIIGYGSVEVEVQTGTTLSGAWNSGVLTVTASPQQETYTAQLSAAATTWDGNTGSRVIWDGTAPDAQHGRLTGYTVSVDATVRYNAGVTDGKNAVTINKGSWSSGQISFTKSEGTASTKTVQLTAAAATWSGNTASVKMWDGTAADAQHGSDTGYTVTVDASGRYNAGVTAGKNAVTISKGSWSGGQVTFSKSDGTASNSGVKVSLGGSWSGNSYNYTIYDSWSGSAASTGYTGTIDATARYNAGYSAGVSSVSVGVSPSTTQTLGYGGSVTVYAQKNGTSVAGVQVKAPADRTVTISPNTEQTLGYGASITVYAKKDGSNAQSVKINAPAFPTITTGFTPSYNTVNHAYAITAKAYYNGTEIASSTSYTDTTAYTAGYGSGKTDGMNDSWFIYKTDPSYSTYSKASGWRDWGDFGSGSTVALIGVDGNGNKYNRGEWHVPESGGGSSPLSDVTMSNLIVDSNKPSVVGDYSSYGTAISNVTRTYIWIQIKLANVGNKWYRITAN